ncbi:MAG: dihydrolipoamide acetyltransferase family protein [Anaerolineales bacterium]|jgi:pyruvate dehydrogenase E2 component (dihydrolipoamide acetyltransferase)
MLKEVIMPQLDATMTTGQIVSWLKKEGEWVKKGEPLIEVMTDKVNIEVESLDSGFLKKIVAQEGEEIPVTQVIAYIGDEADEVPEDLEPHQVEAPSTKAAAAVLEPAKGDKLDSLLAGKVKASPLAKKIAREGGVDIETVQGTGPGGRITKEDVLRAVEEKKAPAPVAAKETLQVGSTPRVAEVIPLVGMRRTIATRMADSFREAPHIVINMAADMTYAQNTRESLLSQVKEQYGVKLSYTDLILKATALALREHSNLNACLDGEEIKIFAEINVGLAVALPAGLIVPTIYGADQLTLGEIASKRDELVKKAQGGTLSREEVSGGTFTLSNLGMLGVESFTAVINPPQAAILAIGQIEERVVPLKGQIVVRPYLSLSLSADHRVVDGAQAAAFLSNLKHFLESPSLLLNPNV